MNVQNLFEDLSRGELSNLSLANDGNGTIQVAAQPKILLYANDALLRLYSRFVLKENVVLVQMHEHITFYHLLQKFAVNYVPLTAADDEPIRYIRDLPLTPFEGDVLKVLSVFNFDGTQLPLNDDALQESLFSPQARVLQVPLPVQGKVLSVLYQARHRQLRDNLEQVIELPDVLSSALTAYVAYKVFSHMGTQDSSVKAQEHLAIYEGICADVVEKDLVSSSISTSNTRFSNRGWI
jgi:hypothetical protein